MLPEAVHPDGLERVVQDMYSASTEKPKTWHTLRYREARKDASWADIESLYTTRGNLYYGITRVRLPQQCSLAPPHGRSTLTLL